MLSIHDILTSATSAPVFFVGSGFSRRYIGLKSWTELLRSLSAHTDKPFEFFLSSADSDLPKTARLIGEHFHEIWWNSPKWSGARAEHSSAIINTTSALRIEIARNLEQLTISAPPREYEEEIALFQRLPLDVIVTTNWDRHLEQLFPEFETFVGQDQLMFSPLAGVGEIYKIHGCITDPEGLVLTDVDYQSFREQNTYLIAKLITLFVEHPVVFMGYSLSDPHIQEILLSIAAVTPHKCIEKLRRNLIFVEYDADCEIPQISSRALSSPGKPPLEITQIRCCAYKPIFESLATRKRQFPARTLRLLKNHVYEIAKSESPTDRLYVADIDDADPSVPFDVVFGVGVQRLLSESGYRGISPDDIFQDVLLDESKYEADKIIGETVPRLAEGQRKYLPVYRYLSRAGLPTNESTAGWAELPRAVRKFANTEVFFDVYDQYKKHKDDVERIGSFRKLVSEWPRDQVLYCAPLLGVNGFELEELHAFIVETKNDLPSMNGLLRTGWHKLVCIYDYLRYGR